MGVHYVSPSKKVGPHRSFHTNGAIEADAVNKLRAKTSALNVKRLISKQPENQNLYRRKKSWRVQYAERYFEQKSLHLRCKKLTNKDLKQKKILNKSMVDLYK